MKPSRQRLINALKERQRFEMLLLEISGWFINIPVDQIDQWIEKAQGRVCECFQLDLSGLWQWTFEKPSFLTMTHLHSPPDGPTLPTQINAKEAFSWLYDQLFVKVSGLSHAFSTEHLPPQAARDKETLHHYGVKSTVVLPLSAGGSEIIGVLTFDTLWEECEWSDDLKVDGNPVQTITMPHTLPMILQWDESFDIGSDTLTGVNDADYQPPFPLNAKLNKLTLQVDRPKLAPEDIKKLEMAMRNNKASE